MKPELKRESAGSYSLSGALNFETVASLYDDADIDMTEREVSVSLREVRDVDSAGLALLVEWCRQAEQHECRLQLQGIPPHLQNLIDVMGLKDILNRAEG